MRRLAMLLLILVVLGIGVSQYHHLYGQSRSIQVDSYVIWRDGNGATLTAVEVDHKRVTCYVLMTPDRRVQAPYAWDGSVSCVSR